MNLAKLWFTVAGVVFIGLEWAAIFQGNLESMFFYGGLAVLVAGLLAKEQANG